jgi:phage tail-like protein
MADIKSQAVPACRFYVEVKGGNQAVFTEASGLAIEMATDEIEEGGNNAFAHRLPGRCKVGNLTLKRGLTPAGEFLKWIVETAQGKIEPVNVTVTLFQPDGNPALALNLLKAYPVKWSGVNFNADASSVAIETLELTHDGVEVK